MQIFGNFSGDDKKSIFLNYSKLIWLIPFPGKEMSHYPLLAVPEMSTLQFFLDVQVI